MTDWIAGLFSVITSPIADISGSYRERKRIAAESASVIAKAEVDLKLSELKAKEKRFHAEFIADNDYDLKVLDNRNKTAMDELLIGVWLTIFACHFFPLSQSYMHGGWQAMGYESVPWWFEFGMVGILVSTLGLMRLFKLLIGRWKNGRIAV